MAVRDEPDFAAILARVARALTGGQIPFMVIGGQAVLVHGEPRLTQDIDLTVGISIDRLADVLAACNQASLSFLPDDVDVSCMRRSCCRWPTGQQARASI